MVFTFARVGAMVVMTVEDYYTQGKRSWLRLQEKGGKQHEMPAHHSLEEYLDAYLDAAGIAGDQKSPLFRTAPRTAGSLTRNPMKTADAWRMIRRRIKQTDIETETGCHSFRATGPTTWKTRARWKRPSRWPLTQGVIAPVPGIMRLFWAFSPSTPPESPSQEDSSLANMLDTLEARCRSDGPPAGPRSIDPLPGSRSFLTVSAVA